MIEKIEIDRHKPLSPGDRLELHFTSLSMVWITAAQIAIIDARLESRKEFRILSWQFPANNKVVFTVEILKTNPIIVTAAIIGGLIIGAGVLAWLTLDKVYQIMESPAGKIAIGGLGTMSIAAGVAIIMALLSKGK